MKGNKASISHLMFADDLILFGEAHIDTISSIKEILQDFSSESSLLVNPKKAPSASLEMLLMKLRKSYLNSFPFLSLIALDLT